MISHKHASTEFWKTTRAIKIKDYYVGSLVVRKNVVIFA